MKNKFMNVAAQQCADKNTWIVVAVGLWAALFLNII